MKKTLFSFLCFLVISWSCTRNDDVIKTTDSDDIWHITINAQKSDEETKSLYFSENGALKIKWEAGEKVIAFISKQDKWEQIGTLTATPKSTNSRSAVLSGDFTSIDGLSVGSTIHLLFPRDTFNYVQQLGTLESISENFDFSLAQAMISNINTVNKTIETEGAIFQTQQSIFKFKFTDGTNPIAVKRLKISTINDKLISWLDVINNRKIYGAITVTPATATNELFVAMRNETENSDTYLFTVIADNNKIYTASKNGNLVNGKYYTSTIVLTQADYIEVESKINITSSTWTNNIAQTLYTIPGFTPTADPSTSTYGGWSGESYTNTQKFFKVAQSSSGRWWFVDPNGRPFISKGVCSFTIDENSARQVANVQTRWGTSSNSSGMENWSKNEKNFLTSIGINTLGAWSNSYWQTRSPLKPFTFIISPMGEYNKYLKNSGREAVAYAQAKSWEGYPYDFAMVFDDDFDTYVESATDKVITYKANNYLIGYFIDNELPWKDYALEMCLTKWPATHINHIKAQEWLDNRKGRSGCTIDDATQADKNAFIAYCYEVYLQKVTTALRAKDPNHLILGNRFNQWNYELQNEDMWRVAGQYLDVISVNHYHKWQPDQSVMSNWLEWSGKPFIITEFYTMGLDSGLQNHTGVGYIVKTQFDRGVFYQNFVIELLKSKGCIGWHWFQYMDNDPTSTDSDASNQDSNKGIVMWNCNKYTDFAEMMKEINNSTYRLAKFFNP